MKLKLSADAALNCACCPASGCDAHSCALERFITESPHLIVDHKDNPYVCKKFRKAAWELTGKPAGVAEK